MRPSFFGRACCTALITLWLGAVPALAQFAGHGGPVRALAVSSDGATLLSGSFDSSAIRWSLRDNVAQQVLRFHEGAVNAVALLPDGRAVTAGEDGRIGLWTAGKPQPDQVLSGHRAPVAALAVAPGAALLASGSWDGTIRLWQLKGGAPGVIETQQQNVNALAFSPDGKVLASAGYDGTLRLWPMPQGDAPVPVALPTPLNALAVLPAGGIIAAGADGKAYRLSPGGEVEASAQISEAPVTALAVSRDGERIAAANIRGTVVVIDAASLALVRELTGGGGPVWAVAFLSDGKSLLAGGADRLIRRWDLATGQQIGGSEGQREDALAAYAGDPGAGAFRACSACHTLKADEGNRAGPSLHGLFGRRIASLPGYNFSPALKQLDIVWTPQTLRQLFEQGPARYTPGTKMPEQRIGNSADLDALISFLERATQ